MQSLDAFPASRLAGPLADAQSAPPLWLLAVRAVTTVAGDGERAYRLVALVCGCATLVVLAMLAAALVRHRWAAVVPVLAFATISQLVFYTAQTKQYTADTLSVSWLLLAGVRLLSEGDDDGDGRAARRWEPAWYVCLVVLPWCSHAFMLCAPVVAGWVSLVRYRRGERRLRTLTAGLALPAVSVLAAALLARHLTGQVSDFATYWAGFFGPRGADLAGWLDWHRFVFTDLALRELGFRAWWGWLPVLAGFAVALRRRADIAVLPALPLHAGYVAGVLGIYPFGARLVLFCVPGLLCYLALLIDGLVDGVAGALRRRPVGAVAGGVAGLLVLATCWTTPARLGHDLNYLYGVDDYRTAFALVASKWQPGDVLVVGNGDRAAARVYGPRFHLPATGLLRAIRTPDERPRARCPMPREVTTANRVWLLTGDVVPVYAGPPSRYAIVAPMLDRYHVGWQQVRGRVTVQAVVHGRASNARPARCLDYAPVGPPGSPELPPRLPAS